MPTLASGPLRIFIGLDTMSRAGLKHHSLASLVARLIDEQKLPAVQRSLSGRGPPQLLAGQLKLLGSLTVIEVNQLIIWVQLGT